MKDKNCEDNDSFLLSDFQTLMQGGGASESRERIPCLVRGDGPLDEEERIPQALKRQGPAALIASVLDSALKTSCIECTSCISSKVPTFDPSLCSNSQVSTFPSSSLVSTFIKCQTVFLNCWRRYFHKHNLIDVVVACFALSDNDWSWLQCEEHFNVMSIKIKHEMAVLLIKRKCLQSNKKSKKGVFKRTRQILAGAVKDCNGILGEEDGLQLHPHDFQFLTGSQSQQGAICVVYLCSFYSLQSVGRVPVLGSLWNY